MYWNEFRKVLRKTHKSSVEEKRGFIIIYTVFITTLCFILILACFKLQSLQKVNNQNHLEKCLVLKPHEKAREYLFTELDDHIHKHVNGLNDENIKAYFQSVQEFNINYNSSYLEYLKEYDCFLGVYFSSGKFYKEELYSYKADEKDKECVLYECTKYSFEKGELKIRLSKEGLRK